MHRCIPSNFYSRRINYTSSIVTNIINCTCFPIWCSFLVVSFNANIIKGNWTIRWVLRARITFFFKHYICNCVIFITSIDFLNWNICCYIPGWWTWNTVKYWIWLFCFIKCNTAIKYISSLNNIWIWVYIICRRPLIIFIIYLPLVRAPWVNGLYQI